MKLLLDTHTLIWSALAPTNLSRRAALAIESEANTLLLSSATAWEIATKVRLGKLAGAEELERDLLGATNRAGYTWVALSPEVALRAGRLQGRHKDPFDRMIAAQALALDISVISNDSKLDEFGVRRIWS
jgi:PIN domain nuclease of toxin-antitoxin system